MAAIPSIAWPLKAGLRPRVYMVTLGTFEVYVDQQPAVWTGGAAGARQLQRAVAYLIAHRNWLIRKEELIEVAGGRSRKGARHVINGVQRLLRTWGIEFALTIQNLTIGLRKHETWGTDTDALIALFDEAQALHENGHDEQAISVLQDAAPLCGGDYLFILDTVPEYMPHGDSAYWKTVQKKVLTLLAKLCLAMPKAAYHEQALWAAGHAIELDRFDPNAYMLAARATRQCGNEEAARRLERKAHALKAGAGER